MTAAGIIFSNIHDACIPEFTRVRTMASIPFGGRYRLIDFPLSNYVNSGITNIGIITHYNYQSLLDHIGNGKDWDLARRSGGIRILPPFITAYDNAVSGKVYNTRLEALIGASSFITRCSDDDIVLSDCDAICNVDLSDVLRQHRKTGAEITIVSKRAGDMTVPCHDKMLVLSATQDGVLTDIAEQTAAATKAEDEVSTNIMVFKRTYLCSILAESLAHGYTGLHRDVLRRYLYKGTFRVYRFEGEYACVTSLEAYFNCNMALLDPKLRSTLFGVRGRPIYTKVRNSAPTHYADSARVENSLVADGCSVEGIVENSVLFRGVHIGKGVTVKNCILLQGTFIGDNVSLNCVIADKNAVIREGRVLSGHETMPFFIGKGIVV